MRKLIVSCAISCLVLGLTVSASAADKPKPDMEAQFKKLDKDSDGKLSLVEMTGKKTGEDAEKVKKAFGRLDANKDGSVSLEEFKNRPAKKTK